MAIASHRLAKWARWLWASPCTAVGAVAALPLLATGGRARWVAGALEVTFRPCVTDCGPRLRALPFRGIVFGHIILAVTEEELRQIGPHERVHVAQCERWGPFFFVAYGLSSLWQLLRGRDVYRDNHFEVQARALSGR